jgi:hypothetical protein
MLGRFAFTSLGCSTQHLYRAVLAQSHARGARRFFAPAPPPPEQKCGMRGSHVDRALLSSKAVSNYHIRGKRMAIIPMIPVGPVTTLTRSILLTERGMSGTGGDDFICGHCGHVMLEDFDPSTVRGNPVYQCGVCENNNDLPFAASDGRHWSSR